MMPFCDAFLDAVAVAGLLGMRPQLFWTWAFFSFRFFPSLPSFLSGVLGYVRVLLGAGERVDIRDGSGRGEGVLFFR